MYEGETLGLVGESGCGKTTLGRTILHLEKVSSGNIFYKGKDITRLTKVELKNMRKEIQLIFQDPFSSLNPRISVGNSILEPMTVHQIMSSHKERKLYVLDLLKKATKELIDQVYGIVNDRNSVIKTLAIAKSAIRHNMASDLPNMKQPTCLIWGKQDNVTPPEVADDFHKLLPNSNLYWIDKCGHAAMMERPEEFNQILEDWLTSRNI